jgi:rhamnosyltransferase
MHRSYLMAGTLKPYPGTRLASATGGPGSESVAIGHQTFRACDARRGAVKRRVKVNPPNSLPLPQAITGGRAGSLHGSTYDRTPGRARLRPTGRVVTHHFNGMNRRPGRMDISVVIRNRNECAHLRHVLRALSLQDTPAQVILVDNASTDDSVLVAREFGATIVTLAQDAFTYGRALNAGLRVASGEVCVILSAHSVPIGPRFLSDCAKPFAHDPRVAAVRCVLARKLPDALRWMEPELLVGSVDAATVIAKGPLASGCAIRRSVWEEIPFDEALEANEDKLWALAALRRGYAIYSPSHATYAYLKGVPPLEVVRRVRRERVAVFRATGLMAARLPDIAKDLAYAVFRNAPAAAWNQIASGVLEAYYRLRQARDARRVPRSGSLY